MRAPWIVGLALAAGCGGGSGDAVDAAAGDAAGDGGGDGPADADGCPSRTGITAGVGQVLVIQSADFVGDTLVIRNLGASTVSGTLSISSARANTSWRL